MGDYSESGNSESTFEKSAPRDSAIITSVLLKSDDSGLTKDLENADDLPLGPGEKWRIMKNVVVLSLAFMVHFTAFQVSSLS